MKALTATKKIRKPRTTRGGARENAGRKPYTNPNDLKQVNSVIIRVARKEKLVKKYGGLTKAIEHSIDPAAELRDEPYEGTLKKDGKKTNYTVYLRPAQITKIMKKHGSLANALLKLK